MAINNMSAKAATIRTDRPVSKLHKQGLEGGENDSVDKLKELLKFWDDRITRTNLAESYLKCKLRVHVHCRAVGSLDSQEFCALFQGKPPGREFHGARHFREKRVIGNNPATKIDIWGRGGHAYEKLVLVHDVQSMKTPYYIALPSLVRFQRLDTPDHFGIGARYFSCDLGFDIGDSGGPMPDRKTRIVVRGAPAGDTQLVGKIIQTGTEIVDCVSQNQGDLRREFLTDAKPDDAISRLGLIMSDLHIGTTIAEGSEFRLEILDVLCGPTNFPPDPI